MQKMKILGIIPARYASTRFPGKILADINGKSMIQRVFEQASQAKSLKKIIVATDHHKVFEHVQHFGGNVMMTSTAHQSGTDRCAEVLTKTDEEYHYVINIQGDEPFILPTQIDQLASLLDSNTQIATLIKKIDSYDNVKNYGSIKVFFCVKTPTVSFFKK